MILILSKLFAVFNDDIIFEDIMMYCLYLLLFFLISTIVGGEASKHVDFLAWEKGRESSFNAAALFYTKASRWLG